MDTEQITQLINDSIKTALEQASTVYQDKLSAAMANAKRERDKFKEQKPDEVSLENKSLQAQLDSLTKQIGEEKSQATSLRRDNAVLASVGALSINNPEVFKTVVMSKYGAAMKEDNGQFYVEDGENVVPLKQAFENYLATEEASIFVPASKVKGTGSKSTETQPVVKTQDFSSLLEQSFKQ